MEIFIIILICFINLVFICIGIIVLCAAIFGEDESGREDPPTKPLGRVGNFFNWNTLLGRGTIGINFYLVGTDLMESLKIKEVYFFHTRLF